MINSHLLYRLSYRGTTVRILLIAKEKSTPVKTSPGFSEDFYDGFGNCANIAAVQCCHADASRAHGIDAELAFQAFYLFGRQAGIGEHAALAGHKGEVAFGAETGQLFNHGGTHVANALAHLGQFLLPHGT